MAAQHATLLEQQSDEMRMSLAARAFERLTADEAPLLRLEGHGPGETGPPRVKRLVHVIAVEIHAGLEAQGVARAESGRPDAQRDQALPYRNRLAHRHHELEAVLAGVAGARHEPGAEEGAEEGFERERGRALLGRQ